jgi:hypothetical protein
MLGFMNLDQYVKQMVECNSTILLDLKIRVNISFKTKVEFMFDINAIAILDTQSNM